MAKFDEAPIISGMSEAELHDFKAWLRDCLGYDFDNMPVHELCRAAGAWYDECFALANPEYFPDYFLD